MKKEFQCKFLFTLMFSLAPCRRINMILPKKSLPVRSNSEVNFSMSLTYLVFALMWSKCNRATHVPCSCFCVGAMVATVIKPEEFSLNHESSS